MFPHRASRSLSLSLLRCEEERADAERAPREREREREREGLDEKQRRRVSLSLSLSPYVTGLCVLCVSSRRPARVVEWKYEDLRAEMNENNAIESAIMSILYFDLVAGLRETGAFFGLFERAPFFV